MTGPDLRPRWLTPRIEDALVAIGGAIILVAVWWC